MSSHSQFKKFNILHELEQAIKKKTQEKYAPNRSKSRTKPSENIIKPVPVKSPGADKQQQVPQSRKNTTNPTKGTKILQFKIKKHQNKKFDKIVSLINYTITSADKALKYVNLSSNFEAEFAYKLYLSDRENLMNELNNLSLSEVLAQSGAVGYTNAIEMKGLRLEQPSSIIESNHLKQENDKLRKEIILLENQLRKSQFQESKSSHSPYLQNQSLQPSSIAMTKSRQDILKKQSDFKDRQILRISDLLKKICEFSEIYDFLELIEKESKYRYILSSIGSTGYDVSSKQRQEIDQNIAANEKKLAIVEKEIVRKMGDLLETSPQNQELIKEYQKVKQIVDKKIGPALKQATGQEFKYSTLGQALTIYMNLVTRKQRENKLLCEKLQAQMSKLRGGRQQVDKKEQFYQKEITKLNNDNTLLKENLRDIYESLLSIAFPDQNDSEKTFEQILDHLTDVVESHINIQKNHHALVKENNSLKQENQIAKNQNNALKSEFQKLKQERSKRDHIEHMEIEKYSSIINNLEEEIASLKNVLSSNENVKQELEDLLQSSQSSRRELQEENIRNKGQVSKLKKQLGTRMEEMREYASVCGKLQQNYTSVLQDNQHLMAEINENKEVQMNLRAEKARILEHMKELEERLKEYEIELNNREEIDESADKIRYELSSLHSRHEELQEREKHLEDQIRYRDLKLQESKKELKTLNSDLMKKQEKLIEIQFRNQMMVKDYIERLKHLSQQYSKQGQECQHLHQQLQRKMREENEQTQYYQQMLLTKTKEIDELQQLLASKKQVEILNIQENYNTKYKSSRDLKSSNELKSSNQINSQHDLVQALSSNQSPHSPKSFYERQEDEVIIKEKIEQLEEMNQISQIKANELNEVKELLEQKNIEFEAMQDNLRDLETQLLEREAVLASLQQKYAVSQSKVRECTDELERMSQQTHQFNEECRYLKETLAQKTQQFTSRAQRYEQAISQYEQQNNKLKELNREMKDQLQHLNWQLKQKEESLNNSVNDSMAQVQAQRDELAERCNRLGAALMEKESELEQLSNVVNDLTQRYEAVQTQNHELVLMSNQYRKNIEEMQQFLHQKQQEIMVKNDEANFDSRQVEIYKAQLSEMEANYKIILNANAEYQKIVSDQVYRFNELKEREKELRSKLETFQQNQEKVSGLAAQLNQANDLIFKLRHTIDEITAQVDLANSKIAEKQAVIEQRQQQILHIQEIIQEKNQENAYLLTSFKKSQDLLLNSQIQIKILQEKDHNHQQALHQHKNDLEKLMQSNQSHIHQLNQEISQLGKERQQLLQHNQQIEQRLQVQIQRNNEQAITLQHIQQNHNNEVNQVTAQLQEIGFQMTNYRIKFQENQHAAAQLAQLSNRYDALASQYQTIQQQNQQLQSRVAELQSGGSNSQELEQLLVVKDKEIADYKQDINDYRNQISIVIEENKNMSLEYRSIISQYNQNEEKIKLVEEQFEHAKKLIATQQQNIEDLQQEVSQLRAINREITAEKKKLEEELLGAKNMQQVLESNHDKENYKVSSFALREEQLQQKLKEITSANENLAVTLEQLTRQKRDLENIVQNITQQKQEATSLNDALRSKIGENQTIVLQLEQSRKEIDYLNTQILQFQQSQQKQSSEITSILQQVSSLKEQIQHLQGKNTEIICNYNKLQEECATIYKERQLLRLDLQRVTTEKEQNERQLEILLLERENTIQTTDNVVIQELNKKIEDLQQFKAKKNVEINAYVQQINNHKTKFSQMQTQILTLKQQNTSFARQYEQQNIEILRLKEQIHKLEDENFTYSNQISETHQNIDHYRQLQQNETISLQLQQSSTLVQSLKEKNQQLLQSIQEADERRTELELELSNTKIQIHQSVIIKAKMTDVLFEVANIKKENIQLKEILDNRQAEITYLLEEKDKQIQSYQHSHSILSIKINELQENIEAIKHQKQSLQDKLNHVNSSNEVNSLKLISKIKQKNVLEQEDGTSKKVIQLEKLLDDKQQQLENVYKLYQNIQDSFYQNKAEEYHQSLIQENKAKELQSIQNVERMRLQHTCLQQQGHIARLREEIAEKDKTINIISAQQQQLFVKQSHALLKQSELNNKLQEMKSVNNQLNRKTMELQMKIEQLTLKGKMNEILLKQLTAQQKTKEIQQQTQRTTKRELGRNLHEEISSKRQLIGIISNHVQKQQQEISNNEVKEIKNEHKLCWIDSQIVGQKVVKGENIKKNEEVQQKQSRIKKIQEERVDEKIKENRQTNQKKNWLEEMLQYQSQEEIEKKEVQKEGHNEEKKEVQVHQGNDFDDFGDLASEKMGDSMISNKSQKDLAQHFHQQVHQVQSQEQIDQEEEEKKEGQNEEKKEVQVHQGNDFDDFGDLASEKMGDSMISNQSQKDLAQHFHQQVHQVQSQEQIDQEEEEKKEGQNEEKKEVQVHQGNDFDDFGDLASEKMGDSMISNKSQKDLAQHFHQQVHQVQSQEQIDQEEEEKKEGQNEEKKEVQVHQGNDFDDFGDLASEKMGDSMISNKSQKDLAQHFHQQVHQVQSQEQIDQEEEEKKEGQNEEKKEVQVHQGNDFDDFGDLASEKMGDSMISNKSQKDLAQHFHQQVHQVQSQEQIDQEEEEKKEGQNEEKKEVQVHQGNDFDDFGDLASEKMGDSMISNKSQKDLAQHFHQQVHQVQSQEQIDQEEEEKKEGQNEEKKEVQVHQGNDFDDFGDLASEKMGDSMISNKSQKDLAQHFHQQVHQVQSQEQIDQEEEEKKEGQNEEKKEVQVHQGNDFDDFGDLASEKMGDSMISNKSQKDLAQHFHQQVHQVQSQEQIDQEEEEKKEGQNEEKKEVQVHQGNDFDDFGDLASEKMGDSMISNKSQKDLAQHFHQQVHQVQSQEQIDQEEEEKKEGQNEEKKEVQVHQGNDFDDFGDLASEKMGDSMISNKSQKDLAQHFHQQVHQVQSQEQIDQEEEEKKEGQNEEKKEVQVHQGNDFDDFGDTVDFHI